MNRQNLLLRGIQAGALAAASVAVWFFLIDIVGGRPLHTPMLLGSALLGEGNATGSPVGIAVYSLLHLAAFALAGIAVSWILHRWQLAASWLMGATVGFMLFDIVFYAGVILTGTNVVRELGWPQVLAGNVLAGLVMVGWLERTAEVRDPGMRARLRRHPSIREGLIAGLLGAGAVASWFLVYDVVRERVLFTPSALGSAIFYGARGVAAVQMDVITIGGYTLLHIAGFVVAGLIASALITQAEHEPRLLLGFALLFAVFETFFFGVVAIAAAWLLDALHWSAIAGGNLIAAWIMGAYLWRKHPVLQQEIRNHGGHLEDEDSEGQLVAATNSAG